ncbi:hypothetical protein HZS_7896 [Henneguya salminicola]|nr:hypothetical protein HZS_7896 [Henneguya salminicola]
MNHVFLLITLLMNNAILIMGNVGFHKTVETQTKITKALFEHLYLPPFSLFLNPSENGSSLIKSEDIEGYHRTISSYISRSVNSEQIFY